MTPAAPPADLPSILLVDDDPEFLQDFRDFLRAALPGAQVDTASSGPAGLEVLRARQVDVVISDYKMPGMDGLRFLETARRQYPDVPRLMLTGYPDREAAMEAVNQGQVGDFIPKPPDPSRTLHAIQRALIERQIRLEASRGE